VKCNKCGEEKPLTEFYKSPWRKYGYNTICKVCIRKQVEGNRKPKKAKNNWLWTNTAVDCYKRNCICTGCLFENYFTDKKQKCQMKIVVNKLIKEFGKPKEEVYE